ncbi:PQQ-binding-like beta-propeller repeat protein [Nesterenkonia sp. MY13]|uniref:PQQ-binding-like beta-propeller repeat protein n=1 Tax=Nesterenkonia sedimenti TaxID=1463632 RepID=A0A7X8THK8_9MICC|nr:PQQ-binding-like beta-propeller repeat protein [Nesterenkonia sedimenti]NLS08550.1 PQQ-binding-like beta-propeller repeat protein [Nesterenkonia sedimenti]
MMDSALLYAPEGEILWESSYYEVFGDDFTPDQGWSFRDVDTAPDVVLGWARHHPTQERGPAQMAIDEGEEPEPITQLTSETTHYVALDKATGETVWEKRGLSSCPNLPPVNGDLMTLCHWTSGEFGWTVDEDGWELNLDEPLEEESVELLGIDPASGDVIWDLPVDVESFGSHFISTERSIRQNQDRTVVSIDGDQVIVDMETGDTADLAEGELFLCWEARDPVTGQFNEDTRDVDSGHEYMICDADRESVEGDSIPVDLLNLTTWESDDEDVAFISLEGRLVAYDISGIDGEDA